MFKGDKKLDREVLFLLLILLHKVIKITGVGWRVSTGVKVLVLFVADPGLILRTAYGP